MIDQNNGTGPDRVLFQSGLSGSITLTIDLTTVDEALQVLGPGANVLTINGNNAHRIFNVVSGWGPDVSGLTMTNGNPSRRARGGAILNDAGTLTVQDSNISGNTAVRRWDLLRLRNPHRGAFHRQREQHPTAFVPASDDTTIQDSTISGNESFGLRISRAERPYRELDDQREHRAGLGGFFGYFDLTSTVVSDAGVGPDLFNFAGEPRSLPTSA